MTLDKSRVIFCRSTCTVFELIYNHPKAISKHCCLAVNVLGYIVLYQPLMKITNMKLTKNMWISFNLLQSKLWLFGRAVQKKMKYGWRAMIVLVGTLLKY